MKCLSLLTAIVVVGLPLAAKAEEKAPGSQVYMNSRCFACHGQLGTGGLGPTLAGDRILAIQKFVIAQILIGRGQMPAFGDRLSDDQIAAVAQYIRNNWGNHYGPVTPADVASVRELMKNASAEAAKAESPEKQ
jgi:mono/diheme cytochrome c family protein